MVVQNVRIIATSSGIRMIIPVQGGPYENCRNARPLYYHSYTITSGYYPCSYTYYTTIPTSVSFETIFILVSATFCITKH